MVFFNYATMQMAAKIVYYGPGLCGKTTNLHQIYSKTSPQSRGEMVSLETETDRTLFFDLLPIDVGLIGGFKTRLQLYTVPGQVFYNTTRKLVLKGADGIVFVADSQRAMLDANAESLRNLRENITEIGIDFDELPLVLQLNKRDLPNVATKEELLEQLDPSGRYAHVESSAVNGDGVFETLKLISKLTLRSIRRRMMGDEVQKPALPSQPVFTVTAAPSEPPRAPALVPPVPAAEDDAGVPRPFPLRVATEAPASAPPPQEHPRVEPPLPPPSAAPPSPEPEIVFSENAKAAPAAAGEMKHVKVRSTIDIMA
jgi:mutual gliding-motility protein MglA